MNNRVPYNLHQDLDDKIKKCIVEGSLDLGTKTKVIKKAIEEFMATRGI